MHSKMEVVMRPNAIEEHLKILSLHRMAEIYLKEAEDAAKAKRSYQDYLLRLLEAQVIMLSGKHLLRRPRQRPGLARLYQLLPCD